MTYDQIMEYAWKTAQEATRNSVDVSGITITLNRDQWHAITRDRRMFDYINFATSTEKQFKLYGVTFKCEDR